MKTKLKLFLFAILLGSFQISYAQFELAGDAVATGNNCFILTDWYSQAGAVWIQNVIDLNEPFEIVLELNFDDRYNGADGMAFVLQPLSSDLAQNGMGMGYHGIVPSLAVAMDTYVNGWPINDPNHDHMSMHKNGDIEHGNSNELVSHQTATANGFPTNIQDGQFHTFRFKWEPGNPLGTVTVWFDDVLIFTHEIDLINEVFEGNPYVYWGVTAATGGEFSEHQVCLTLVAEFTFDPTNVCINEEIQFTDHSVSSMAPITSWYWDFGDGTTSNLQHPTHAYDAPGTYTVSLTITTANGMTSSTSKQIIITQPEVDAGPDVTICPGESTQLNGSVIGLGEEALIYFEAFDTYNSMAGWTREPDYPAEDELESNWKYYNANYAGGVEGNEDNGELKLDWYPVYDNPWVMSPPLSAVGYQSANLSFRHYLYHFMDGSFVQAEISTDGVNWTSVWSKSTASSAGPELIEVSIDQVAGGAFWIRFIHQGNTNDIYNWYIDDIKVTGTLEIDNFVWTPSTGLSDPNILDPIANPTETITYTLIATDGNGCTGSDQVTVTVAGTDDPTFDDFGPYCLGETQDILPTTSNNGVVGEWNPASISTAAVGTTAYTFTPDASQCANPVTINIVVEDGIVPEFTPVGPFCENTTIAALPTTSNNGITGTWSPTIDNTQTTEYTFTPDAGQCATQTTMTIIIDAEITPEFTPVGPFCENTTIAALPTTSNNGITGTWSPTIDNTQTGTYTFTPDAGQCATQTTMTIIIDAEITPEFTPVGPFCENTTIAALPTTSNNGITGTWSPTIDNTQTGTYTFTPDAGQCAVEVKMTIEIGENPTAVATVDNEPSCNGSTDGSINLTVTGGIAPYTYSWSDGSTVQNLTNVGDGTYSVTVTDNRGCTATTAITISEPDELTASISATDIDCYGDQSTVTIVADGGTPAYSGDGTYTVGVGTHNYTVTDDNGCTVDVSITVSEPDELTLLVTDFVNQICTTPGSATVSANGGTQPYTYTWPSTANGVSDASATQLTAGSYVVTVTDDNGCTATETVSISDDGGITVSAVLDSDVSCHGGDNGSAKISITGGTADYEITWTGGSTTTSTSPVVINNLEVGSYEFIITDADGCQGVANVDISQPDELTASSTASDIDCFGDNATITVTANGGTAPYTDTGTFTEGVGTYTYTVTDDNGCTATTSITISQPDELTASISATDIDCYGDQSTVTIIANGGTPAYSGDGTFTVGVGTHNYTVTDDNGCTVDVSITVSEPDELTLSVVDFVNQICTTPGSATVSANGGTAPYTYTWPSNANGVSDASATQLTAGSYVVTVSDDNACTATTTVEVQQDINTIVVGIANNTGTDELSCTLTEIEVTATGGDTYQWSGGSSLNTATNSFDTPGTYIVTVSDAAGCTSTESITITQDNSVPSFTISGDSEICQGDNTTLTANGTYDFLWNEGSTTASINVSPTTNTTYSVTATATNGCTSVEEFTVNVSPNPTVQLTSNHVCYGDPMTIATTVAPTGTYTYIWTVPSGVTNPGNVGSFTTTVEGTYSVVVSSSSTCTATASTTATYPDVLDALISKTDVSCFEGSDGTIDVTVEGGTPNYSYAWSDGANTQNRTNLTAGVYAVTVTDAIGCTVSYQVPIVQPAEMTFTNSILNVSCHDGDNGGVAITVSGGTAPYNYLWSNNQNNSALGGVGAGTYTVTVTDMNSCTATTTYTVTEPAAIVITAEVLHPNCYQSIDGAVNIDIIGGTHPYTYAWTPTATSAANAQNLSGAAAGTYELLLTDGNNCTATMDFELISPEEIIITETITDTRCDEANGGIEIDVVGGTLPYNYQWSENAFGSTNQNVANLSDQTYTVTVTDDNGCAVQKQITVGRVVPPALTLIDLVNETCSFANAQITVEAQFGTQPYSFQWNNGDMNGETLNNISAGEYTIYVSDADGCIDSINVDVTNHAAPVLTEGLIQSSHCMQNDGSAQVVVLNPADNYTYTWDTNPPQSGQTISNVTAGSYTVTVDDGICQSEMTIIIPDIPGPTAIASANPTYTTIDKPQIRFFDASIGAEYWYWNFGDGGTSSDETPAHTYSMPGEYYVVLTVEDDFGCTDTTGILIHIGEGLQVWIPDAFTPNSDGINETFGPVAIGHSSDGYEMTIFDRWGKQAFISNAIDHRWDGTINGKKVKTNSVFVYRIVIHDVNGKKFIYTGRVTLIYGVE